ncbi:hypothetical protein TRVL_08185 [Trypanosoma vivax]|nr:hypothetical protein TRVL_08185 [Trypanosoma vivax]
MVRHFAVGSRAAGEGAGTGGTHSGRYSQSQQSRGCPARGAAEADQRGDTPKSVGILPAIKGRRSSTCEGRGQYLPPAHQIHVKVVIAQHVCSTIDGPEKPHDARVLQLARRVHFNITTPGGLKAEAPEKDTKVHTMRRVQRFSDFDYQVWTDGSVVPDVSSGVGALVYPKVGRCEVALGAGSLACSYRAECVAMEAGLKRLVDAIELIKTHRTQVVAFAGSLSLLMALNTGPAVLEDAILRRIWDLILRIVRPRVSVNFQFVCSRCGVPRNEAADKAAEQWKRKATAVSGVDH